MGNNERYYIWVAEHLLNEHFGIEKVDAQTYTKMVKAPNRLIYVSQRNERMIG